MEKKYYFRGLGLGIIVTAVIMGIALSGGRKREMTDEEVIARAKELGMIEDSRLLDLPGEETEERKETVDEQENGIGQAAVKTDVEAAEKKEQEPAEAAQAPPEQADEKPAVGTPESAERSGAAGSNGRDGASAEETSVSTAAVRETPRTDTNEMTKQDEDIAEPETDSAKSVTVSSGDGSHTVARKLAEAGVVGSADSYDDFLCANGYDKRLRPGTYRIPANASEEQIARIVTGQE